MPTPFEELSQRIATIADLGGAAGLLGWDQETYMPPGATLPRAHQRATLRTLAHGLLTDPAVGRLLGELEAEQRDPDSDEAVIVRLTRREYDRATKIPGDLVREMSETSSLAVEAWRAARKADDFATFAPWLQRNLDLLRRWCDCFAPYEDIYDPLIDRHEEGLTRAWIAAQFDGLKPRLVDLVRRVAASGVTIDPTTVRRPVPIEAQMRLSRFVTEAVGYSYEHGRLDVSAHPFTSGSSYRDVRLTTRFDPEDPLPGLMASIHEAGHGMHSQNMDPSWYRTFVMGCGSAVAESQSRFFENNVGRSRSFWRWLLPHLRPMLAPAFDELDEESAYRAVNRVAPGLIRVEADEVTYGLHIILRFELEALLLHGELAVDDLPAAWNDRMIEYLGLCPPSDADGVLQDIHWSGGMFGYFPDYLLGSIFAVQLQRALARDIPGWQAGVGAGDFAGLLDWQREHVMRHGRRYALPALAEVACGEPFSWEPYVDYLETKVTGLYG